MPSSAGYVDPKDSLERCIHISEVQRGYQEARQQIFIEYDNESASLCALSEEPEQEAKAGETARVEAAKARSEAIVRREHGSSESMRTKFDNSFFYGPKSGITREQRLKRYIRLKGANEFTRELERHATPKWLQTIYTLRA
jgi:hypothetical protein